MDTETTPLPEGTITGTRGEACDTLIALWDSLWTALALKRPLDPAETARMERRFQENVARLRDES